MFSRERRGATMSMFRALSTSRTKLLRVASPSRRHPAASVGPNTGRQDAGATRTTSVGTVVGRYGDAWWLGAIMLVGLAVRLYGLTGYGIWFDEGYHIALVQQPTVAAMLDAVLSNPPSDPLYVMLLRGWVSLFGHGDAEVRILSVLLSTATIPATYWLGRVIAGSAVGLLGALFFALSPYAVELGQEAALYSLAALTT